MKAKTYDRAMVIQGRIKDILIDIKQIELLQRIGAKLTCEVSGENQKGDLKLFHIISTTPSEIKEILNEKKEIITKELGKLESEFNAL